MGAAALALAACIQGPWDYYPENPPVFRGVFVTGYVLAGKPVEHLCFERVLDLAEEATEAFPFYKSADVRITGRFGGALKTLSLTSRADTPNCFIADPTQSADKGGDFDLSAVIQWDSAGHAVKDSLTGTAHVPDSFSVRRTASAPSLAKTGGVPDNFLTPQFFAILPPNVQKQILVEYGDSLSKYQRDTVGAGAYLAANAQKIKDRILDLISQDKFVYHEGDTLFYLNGALNTLSHYFTADRSPNVGAVLITQRFEKESSRPETRFDSPLGFKPESSQYYFPGDLRRLLLYPDAKSSKGWNLLDSMGVVNTWFHTLRNRFYFYGMERAYYDFNSTATQVQGGGGQNGDPRVKPKYNVRGGAGIFVGGIPDSFDVYIKVDSLTKSYPLPRVHALYCQKKGWFSDQDCREYYPEYCKEQKWKEADCALDAVRACLEADSAGDTATKALCSPAIHPAADTDAALSRAGHDLYCAQGNFPDTSGACAQSVAACLDVKGQNGCKSVLWDYCLDNAWRPPQCGAGLASYCHDRPRLSDVLCDHADAYCAANPGSLSCQ